MTKVLLRFFFFILACSLSFPARTAEPPPGERRVIPDSVLDRDGKFVAGLTAANFRGEFRGQPVKILSAELDTNPRRIVLLVDVSRSMENPREKWDLAWAAAEDAVSSLAPTNSVAFCTFSEGVEQHTGFTREAKELRDALALAKARGTKEEATYLFKAIIQISQGWSPPGFGDAIYVLTDGLDTSGPAGLVSVQVASGGVPASREQAEIEATRSSVRIFTLEFNFNDPAEYPVATGVRGLPQRTGGLRLEVVDRKLAPAELIAQTRVLREAATAAYRLVIELSRSVDKQREWNLEVADAQGEKLKDVQVAYPRLLVPVATSKRLGKALGLADFGRGQAPALP